VRIGEARVDLVSRILLGALQLSITSDTPASRLRVPPLATLLTTALGAMIHEPLIAQAVRALGGEADADDLVPVGAAISEAALRVTGAHARLERAGDAIDTLLVIYGLAQEPALADVRVQIVSLDCVAYLSSVVVSRPGVSPLSVLIGSASVVGERLEIPLSGGDLLDNLRMSYVDGEGFPRWLTGLWVRRPPDPVRRRLEDWSGLEADSPTTLEIYRRQVPGEGPMGLITTELAGPPHQLASPGLELSLELLDSKARVVRTTIRDKYQVPLLVANRVLKLV